MKKSRTRQVKEMFWNARRLGISPDKWAARISRQSPKVFQVSVPKTGTHLLERAVCLHPAFYRRVMRTLHGATPDKYGGMDRILDTTRSGQVLVAHMAPKAPLLEGLKRNQFKSIFITRDPRAMMLSMIDFILDRPRDRHYELFRSAPNLKERIRIALLGNEEQQLRSLQSIYQKYAGWLDSDALIIRFEALVGQQGGGSQNAQQETVQKVFQHLEFELSDAELEEIANKAFYRISPTFREGKSEGWRKHFDAESIDLFKEHANDTLVQYGYEVDDNW